MSEPRILVVEDDSDLQEMLETYFRLMQYDVVTASWGSEALQIVRDQTIHLIVLDIRLPDIDGYEVCRQLRAQRRTQDLPIIFLTEKRDRMDKLHGLELGVVDYITKPFDNEELRLRVRNALARAQKPSLTHRVTELPEGPLVDERLNFLTAGVQPWSVVAFSLTGLDNFRERYGFVAADDVLRAVALMMRNAVRELGGEQDFIGHLGSQTFVLLTDPTRATTIRERVQMKMLLSREFFYPLQDREDGDGELKIAQEELLNLQAHVLDHTQPNLADANAVRASVAAVLLP
jgi:PleD family two-component response regulator